MSKNTSLGKTTKSRARLLVAALIDLASCTSLETLRQKYCDTGTEPIRIEQIGNTSVKLTVSTTMSRLCSFVVDYEKEFSQEQIFLEASKNSDSLSESVIQERVRDTISALKALGILKEKKSKKVNDKNRKFYLPLKGIDKEPNIRWLFDKADCEWTIRKAELKAKEVGVEENSHSAFVRITDLAKSAAAQKGREIASYLPRGNDRIWGRGKFLANMLDYFSDPDSKSIISLSGPPGYGKTEAATCLGWQAIIRGTFDDVLYVRARQSLLLEPGPSTGEQEFDNALDWKSFSQSLSQQLRCPVDQIARNIRIKRYLIILDNAETSRYKQIIEMMEPMLNPSYLLLTSRVRSDDHRIIYTREVEGIDYEDAYLPLVHNEAKKQNIRAIQNASEDVLQKIYQLSDGAPLAIHFILSRAKTEDTLDHVISDLERANKRVANFYDFTFKFSWNYVSQKSRDILFHLAQFSNSVSENEVKKVLQISEVDFRQLKKELRLVYLVQVDTNSGQSRLDLHPWIRTAINGKRPKNWSKPSLSELKNIINAKFGDK